MLEYDVTTARSLFLSTFTSLFASDYSFYIHKFSFLKELIPLSKAKDEGLVKDRVIKSIPPIEQYKAPKYPIVLCHGLSGFDKLILIPSIFQLTKMIKASILSNHSDSFMQEDDDKDIQSDALVHVDYWIGVREALEARGCTVITAKVPSFGSIEERAKVLNSFIDTELGKVKRTLAKGDVYNTNEVNSKSFKKEDKIKVNLIAHSMGGLDCRYLISHIPNKNFEVCSLTTISTPHHGSEMADYVVGLFSDMTQTFDVNTKKKLLPPAFYQLTTTYCSHFNKITPDDPSVAYFSYGACFKPRWYNMFYMSWCVISNLSGGVPNDGMVSIQSARWGRYLGTLENVDHSDLINWKNRLQKEFQYRLQGTLKKPQNPDIDILHFYLKVTENLANLGF